MNDDLPGGEPPKPDPEFVRQVETIAQGCVIWFSLVVVALVTAWLVVQFWRWL